MSSALRFHKMGLLSAQDSAAPLPPAGLRCPLVASLLIRSVLRESVADNARSGRMPSASSALSVDSCNYPTGRGRQRQMGFGQRQRIETVRLLTSTVSEMKTSIDDVVTCT